ncbi:hypothetical protein [Methylotenera sp.]|uniref:hypothetical protein n=1 Tax=Methylotenera sp. TaxID=2051956 RepID=UPI0025D311F4|nr:hypothetical protein [Methylotenera sp.]
MHYFAKVETQTSANISKQAITKPVLACRRKVSPSINCHMRLQEVRKYLFTKLHMKDDLGIAQALTWRYVLALSLVAHSQQLLGTA